MDLLKLIKEHDYNLETELCASYKRHGSDKSTWHNYSGLYKKIFDTLADREINFLEVGLGTNNPNIKSNMGYDAKPGASLYTIAEHYPNWNVFGLDIDTEILFQEEKIKTFFVDQTDEKTIQELWTNDLKDIRFDIMIDDGLHEFSANRKFFENSFDKLSDGGYYIIEDILNREINLFGEYFSKMNITFHLFNLPHATNKQDNNLLIIQKPL